MGAMGAGMGVGAAASVGTGGLNGPLGDVNAAAWYDAVVALAAGDNDPSEALVGDWSLAFRRRNGPRCH